MKRFVGLDGIKGLALIAIVLYHCMQQRLPGGFYGVDVFFTVSGFLIAVSLIRSLAKTGSLNLVRYIPKRAVRLYPALFLLIPVIVSVGWLFDHDILVSIRDQVITVLLGCYNWYAIAGGQSYFDQMNPQVFRHLWFIGVLMQFYVIVPFIVWLMWKLRQTKLPSLIPLGLAAFSSIAMWVMYVPKGDPTRVYFGTDTHSMGLMLGVALPDAEGYSAKVSAMIEKGLLCLTAGHSTIRLLPPLTISQEEMDRGLAIMAEVLGA